MKEEFKRLMKLLQEHQQGKPVNLDELLKASTLFFKHLQEEFLTADPSEKKEILEMVNEMYTAMAAQARQISRATGMTQEDIAGFVQNPNNFSPEQWKLMQDAKEQIATASKGIAAQLQKYADTAKGPTAGGPASEPPPTKPEKKGPHRKRGKDKWMKS